MSSIKAAINELNAVKYNPANCSWCSKVRNISYLLSEPFAKPWHSSSI